MKTVVYRKRYAESTRANLQGEAEKAIQEAFAKAEKLIDEKGGEITISFKDDESNSTLTVSITGPEKIVTAFTRIFKEWKQVKHVRIANTISQRRYNTISGMMAADSTMIQHTPKVNRKSNTIPTRIGTITTNAAYVGLPISNIARVSGTRKASARNVLRGLPYNASAATAFASFKHMLEEGGTAAVANFAIKHSHPHSFYQRLVEQYAAEEIKNARIANPSIRSDELIQVGIDAFMFAGIPIFVENTPKNEKERRIDLLHRAAMRTVPILVDRSRGLRSR